MIEYCREEVKERERERSMMMKGEKPLNEEEFSMVYKTLEIQ